MVGDQLVVSALKSPALANIKGATLWVARVDLRTGRETVLPDVPVPEQRPAPVVANGRVVWPRGALTSSGTGGTAGREAWFLDPVSGVWSSVELPVRSGPLSGSDEAADRDWRVSTDTLVALRGHLYDPVAGLWSPVPDLPSPSSFRVVAGGADSILACYGKDAATAQLSDACYLLRPAAASSPTP